MLWTHWLQAIVDFHAHQREVDKLARLSDHLLDDIGLRRDQLPALRLENPKAAPAPHIAPRAVRAPGVEPALKGCD